VSTIVGADGLRRRLKALRKDVFAPAAKEWSEEASDIARSLVPNRNTRWSKGRLNDSIQPARTKTGRLSSTTHKARVVGHYTGYFVDAGVRPHSLTRRKSRPKSSLGRTVFARAARKPHPGYPARPFRARALREALAKTDPLQMAVEAWNRAD